jgi:hypothetical protein
MMDNKGVIPLASIKYADDHPYLRGKKPGGPTGESPSRARSKTPKAEDKKAASTRRRSKTPKIVEKKATTTRTRSKTPKPVGKREATTEKTPITKTTAEKKEGITFEVSLEEDPRRHELTKCCGSQQQHWRTNYGRNDRTRKRRGQ